FFPGNGKELVALAHHGLANTVFMLRKIKTEAALHAKEVLVYAGEIAIVRAHDFVIAHAESNFAAVGAVRTRRGHVFHFPGVRLVAIRAAGERADRANVDAHAALFAFEMIFAIGDDHAVRAAHSHAEGLDVHALVADAHAAKAQNAARGVVIDQFRPFLFGEMNFFFDEPAGIR